MKEKSTTTGIRSSVIEGARAFLENEIGKLDASLKERYPHSEPIASEFLNALEWVQKLIEVCDEKN